ncbi:MAG TPA: hypothetical protein VGD48_35750 [Kutzneria sp.]
MPQRDLQHLRPQFTQIMVDTLLAALQQRWEQYGTWAWNTHRAHAELIA